MITLKLNIKKENFGFTKKNWDEWARRVMQALYASNVSRIHGQGLAVDGSEIGKYSSRAIYINPKISPIKFTPKTRKKKNPKTRYFPGGYKEFRGFVGRRTDTVDLKLTGQLKEDLIIDQSENEWALGFNSSRGAKIRKGMEDKYGKQIWGLTAEDERNIDKITDEYLKSILNAKS